MKCSNLILSCEHATEYLAHMLVPSLMLMVDVVNQSQNSLLLNRATFLRIFNSLHMCWRFFATADMESRGHWIVFTGYAISLCYFPTSVLSSAPWNYLNALSFKICLGSVGKETWKIEGYKDFKMQCFGNTFFPRFICYTKATFSVLFAKFTIAGINSLLGRDQLWSE